MTDLDDKDLAAIREMQRVRPPSARSLVVNLAVYGPTIVIGILGVALGLYVGRVRMIVGALVLALAWGVGASRSWDKAVHRRKQTLWLRVAGACILAVLALSVTLFITLDVRHRLFGYPLSDATAATLRATLDEHGAVLARRAERYERVGSWRQRLGPRPDLGTCPDASGQADELPRYNDVSLTAGLHEGPPNVTVIFPSGVPVFTEVDTAPAVASLEEYLTRPSPSPVDEEPLLAQAAFLNTQPERLVFLVVDEYTPATQLSNGRAVAGSLRGTAFTLMADSDRPSCAAYIDVLGGAGSPGVSTEAFATAVAHAVDEGPFFAVGDVTYEEPLLDPPRVAVINDVATPLPVSGRVPLEGTDAWLEVPLLVTYTGRGFSMQHPSDLIVSDPTPQQAVEVMDTDGTILRVARGDCATLQDSYGAILAVLHDSGTQRSAMRMIGNARARGAAATATPGTMEVFLLEDPPQQQLGEASEDGAAVELVAAAADAQPRCTLAFLETLRAMPPQWVATALGSVRDEHSEEQHPNVPAAELVQGETRTPMAMDQTLTAPGTDVRVRVGFNPARLAHLAGLQVRVPPGAFARVGGGTSNESELVVMQGGIELHLRVALAPSSVWLSSAIRQAPAPATAPLMLLGAPRVGAVRSEGMPERIYVFDHEGRMLEVSVTYPAGVADAQVDSWLRAVVDTLTRSPG